MAFYVVNVYGFKGPDAARQVESADNIGSNSAYRGFHIDGPIAFRQVCIIASSPEEALEKAESVEVRIA